MKYTINHDAHREHRGNGSNADVEYFGFLLESCLHNFIYLPQKGSVLGLSSIIIPSEPGRFVPTLLAFSSIAFCCSMITRCSGFKYSFFFIFFFLVAFGEKSFKSIQNLAKLYYYFCSICVDLSDFCLAEALLFNNFLFTIMDI